MLIFGIVMILAFIVAFIYLFISEKKRKAIEEEKLDAFKKVVDRNKLKDEGPSIDEVVQTLKDNNIEVKFDIY